MLKLNISGWLLVSVWVIRWVMFCGCFSVLMVCSMGCIGVRLVWLMVVLFMLV